ncbi:substrate-binding domain-containing protein [Thermodesulfobacteriota bacterium]
MKRTTCFVIMVFCSILGLANGAQGVEAVLKMSTTTSTENSGLLDALLPELEKETGIQVKVLAKGTGAAIRDGMDGNVDIIFVHAREREDRFVAEGYGAYRLDVMHNDFVIVGPALDPAKAKGGIDALAALKAILGTELPFVSRGDDSGTHTKEQSLWKATGIALKEETREIIRKGKKGSVSFVRPQGSGQWYFSIGQGMGKTLTFAEEKQAYTLTDRATYLNSKYGREQGLDLEILFEGDPALFNPYGIIPVSPEKHPHVRYDLADTFAKWLVSPKAQGLIAGYTIHGQQAFYADAIPGAK